VAYAGENQDFGGGDLRGSGGAFGLDALALEGALDGGDVASAVVE